MGDASTGSSSCCSAQRIAPSSMHPRERLSASWEEAHASATRELEARCAALEEKNAGLEAAHASRLTDQADQAERTLSQKAEALDEIAPESSRHVARSSRVARVRTRIARDAKRSVASVSSSARAAGESVTMKHVRQLPPSESCSSRVSFESRNGTCDRLRNGSAPRSGCV